LTNPLGIDRSYNSNLFIIFMFRAPYRPKQNRRPGTADNMETIRNVTIVNELGLHARAAAKIAILAQKAKSRIWLSKEGSTVDAASVIDILTIGGICGARVTITVDDPADIAILYKIETLFKQGFGE